MNVLNSETEFDRLLEDTEREMNHCPEFGLDQAVKLHEALKQMRPIRIPVCETPHILLKADTPYVFFVHPGCKYCQEHARAATP